MAEDGFKKIESSDERLYGPRRLVVCGFKAAEQTRLQEMVERAGLRALALVFPTSGDVGKTLQEICALPEGSGLGKASDMDRAVIMSGLTEKELHQVMAGYRATGLAKPLWAALTPVSETWTVKALLEELNAEREAFRKKQGREGRAE